MMAGRYDEICHDNKTPLPANSTPGKEEEFVEENDDEENTTLVGHRKWMNEDNPHLWDGELDADDYADWNNGN